MRSRLAMRVKKLENTKFSPEARLSKMTDEELEAELNAVMDGLLPHFVVAIADSPDPDIQDLHDRIHGKRYAEISPFDHRIVHDLLVRELEAHP